MGPKVVGIVNITEDSFSDGGKYLNPEKAIAQVKKLIEDGADILELSGASSNPNSEPVPASEQIVRVEPVAGALSVPISIDASNVDVQKWALARGFAYLNDITGFPDSTIYQDLARAKTKLVVMHKMSSTDKADRSPNTTGEVLASIDSFFEQRISALEKAGISRERLIIDPGMGFFLSSDPAPSFAVLARLAELKKRFGLPLMVSVSRKSFLRGSAHADSPEVAERTLSAELSAAKQGVDFIRTHDVGPLKKFLKTVA